MVRVGGMGYRIDIGKPQGERLSQMTLLATGEAIEPGKTCVIVGWASVNEGTEGLAIFDLVDGWIKRKGTVTVDPKQSVQVVGG